MLGHPGGALAGGKAQASVPAALDALAKRVPEVYLHINLDALDPQVAPGIVDFPQPGGLTLRELEEAIRGLAMRFRIRAAAVTTYNPDLDQDGKTLRAGLRIIELLVACAGDGEQPAFEGSDPQGLAYERQKQLPLMVANATRRGTLAPGSDLALATLGWLQAEMPPYCLTPEEHRHDRLWLIARFRLVHEGRPCHGPGLR